MNPYWMSPNHVKSPHFSMALNRGLNFPKKYSGGLYILYTCIITLWF